MLIKLCYVCSKVSSNFCIKCKKAVCDLHYDKTTGLCINCKSGLIMKKTKNKGVLDE